MHELGWWETLLWAGPTPLSRHLMLTALATVALLRLTALTLVLRCLSVMSQTQSAVSTSDKL